MVGSTAPREVVIPSAMRAGIRSKFGSEFLLLEPYLHDKDLFFGKRVRVAHFLRQTPSDLADFQNQLDSRYNRYVEILSRWLNHTLGKNYPVHFWQKCMCLSFKRLVTLAYEAFCIFEENIKIANQYGERLDPKAFVIPKSLEEATRFLQHDELGQEQLLSIYIEQFYPEAGWPLFWATQPPPTLLDPPPKSSSTWLQKLRRKFSMGFFRMKYYEKFAAPKLGVFYAYFHSQYLMELSEKSKGKIQSITIPPYEILLPPNMVWREIPELAKGDRMDQFMGALLKYLWPITLLEAFEQMEEIFSQYWDHYPSLTHLVSEAWITSSEISCAIVIAQKRGIIHICNEHNYLSHQFLGNHNPLIAKLSDIFVSMGWSDPKFQNLVGGASLFGLEIQENVPQDIEVLVIGAPGLVKRDFYSGSYGINGEDAIRHIQFHKDFFETLSSNTISRILYRDYPPHCAQGWMKYDLDRYLGGALSRLKQDDFSQSCKKMMCRSKIVVSTYISTSYLETLAMNIPMLFFFDKAAYQLAPEYIDFYDELIKVGICHTDSKGAAQFLESIIEDPLSWWQRPDVQRARHIFLSTNLGAPEKMIQLLLKFLDVNMAPGPKIR